MSRDTSALRHTGRNVSKLSQSEANENEFETSMNLIHFPPPRTPLNTIQDPSQCQKDCQEVELKSRNRKFEAAESNSLQSNKGNGNGNGGSSCGTPMVSGRGLKAQSEPNSAQSSPARSVSKNLSIGQMGACSGSRPPYYVGGRGASSSRVSRGISTVTSEPNLEVPHFELEVDPSFWMDHNVQVLIRIRPINGMERVSQGYGQCLRQESSQTLVWLGHPETRFTFDHIACETISQEKLFRIAGLPMVENCMSGYNSCMFAYGQTGSGKTYTMMGDIYEMESELNENCGITPRIFEYLFTRINVEEENRMDEKLKYSCKCSFLEIYNEQITDLLEPSSTNLQLREDLKKGVYVENLTEYNVKTVNDVVKLLLEGAANRKMAATYMNRESSRSHSVFTCIIESRWEKDSMRHLRFARLNLVDLAGSERQKSSGAEGERLKEAANINKSLSTLGLVIMSLVDLAQGRQRHVPYRDSRLTFLLQDSLGGNSKTMIIANVSPSICTANETLSTLKFAQRAKLIQNNAKVNEDASGDVFALQRQIQLLKGQLSFLMKHHNLPRSLSCNVPCSEDSRLVDFAEESYSTGEHPLTDYRNILSVQNKKMKDMEAILVGALRREKLSETAAKKLKAEIEHMIRLAQERELDAQHTKLMLRFREEKIKRLEFLAEGSISAEEYLMEEKKAFLGEIQLLQSRIDRNPELTRFAVENIRLVEQLQLFQNFYEQGERETLMAEVSELRDQLLEALETPQKLSSEKEQDINTLKELEYCKNMNSRLMREVDELRTELGKYVNCGQAELDSFPLSKDESISVRSDSGDEMASYNWADDEVLQINNDQNMDVKFDMQPSDMQKEPMDARFLIDGMGSEQLRLIEELQLLQEKNERCLKVSSNKEKFKRRSMSKDDRSYLESGLPRNQNNVLATELNGDIIRMGLQTKLDEVTKDLEEARLLTIRYREDQETILSHQHQVKSVFDEVEIETTNTILHLQEEVAALQLELQERLCCTTQENTRLRETIAAKEEEMRALRLEWEAATVELTNFLTEGSKSLKDASAQIESISCSFPQDNVWIREQVQKAARAFVEKEEIVMLLQKSLEDAQNMVQEMGLKLSSLKNATIAFNEVQQLERDESTKQPMQLGMPLDNMIRVLEKKLKCKEDQIIEAEKRADAALMAVKRLGGRQNVFLGHDFEGEIDACKLAFPAEKDIHQKLEPKTGAEAISLEDIEVQVELARLGILESEDAIKSSYADAETHLTSLQADICSISSAYMELVQDLVKDIHEIKEDLRNLKGYQFCPVDSLSLGPCNSPMLENQYCILHKVRAELVETNDRLNTIKDCINTLTNVRVGPEMAEDILEADEWSTDCSTSGSDFSTTSLASQNKVDISSTYCSRWPGEIIEGKLNFKFEEALPPLPSSNQVSEKLKMILKSSAPDETTLLCLKKEIDMAFNAFNEIYVWVAAAFNEKGIGAFSFTPERSQWHLSCKAETSCCGTEELAADMNMKPANSFLDKIEEVHATIREADFMLNALLKANENAKEFSAMWKKAGEELMLERASLMEEVEQLKSSLCLKEQENEILCYQFHNSLVEVENSMTLLEESFLQLRRDVEEWFEVTYSDVLSMGRDILSSTCDSKIYLEDFCSEMMEKGFASFRRYQCKLSEFHQKMPSFAEDSSFLPLWRQKSLSLCSNKYDNMSSDTEGIKERSQNVVETYLEEGKIGLTNDSMIFENMSLKKELEKKEILLKGLLFDFSLLQESASKTKDIKDETEKLIFALGQVRHELEMKTSQLDNILVQHRKVEGRMSETETAILLSNSQLDQARDTIDMLSDQNAELTMVLKDLYLKKSEVEEQLEEQKETVKGLEKEILRLTSPMEKKLLSSVEDVEDELRRVSSERDQLREEVYSLNDKLEVAYALADENKAVAVEARQESEASKIYAEQKEEEVKILERSVEELESTINVLEKKVYELDEEVGRQQLIRDSLELELQFLRQRLLTVENFTENMVSENINVEQTTYQRQLHSRSVELQEAHNRIRFLEEERAEQNREIKQLNEYISELVLHAEAQASQYQQKYKTLENMVHEVKADSLNSTSTALPEKTEKSSTRTRGSSSPFRCIASLVQQMNLEKDHELSMARLRIEELEAMAASRQKEVCMLNSRLAATESMTHDVIRDLLGVKLDMTNYANLIDQQQVQKLVEAAQHETEESLAKEQEVLNLRKQLTDLIDERESCQLELHKKEADILAAQIAVEQLQLRDQLLSAQNEMLKVDKSKLKRKVAELDEMVKKLFNTQSPQQRIRQPTKTKESSTLRLGNADFNKSLAHSKKILSHVNHELAQYRKNDGSCLHRTAEHASERKYQ